MRALIFSLLLFSSLASLSQNAPSQKVYIQSHPSASKVFVNGIEKGNTPLEVQLSFDDEHIIRIVKEGFITEEIHIAILEKKEQVICALKPSKLYPEVVYVQGGEFKMGQSSNRKEDSYPAHEVLISDFYLSKYEITIEQFCDFLNTKNVNRLGIYKGKKMFDFTSAQNLIRYKSTKFVYNESDKNKPITNVTWYGANEYCKFLGGRLPSEAEWEYAAKGGNASSKTQFSGSDLAEQIAWFNLNSNSKLQEVGLKKENEIGLYDMSGNAMEWVNDYYQKSYYKYGPSENPKGPRKTKTNIARGGSFNRGKNLLFNTTRYPLVPLYTNFNLGFRCAFNLK